ncbi:MAG: hypothetical protein LBB56_02980, partial [Chitinispirillales bacterium]|nr:hypothetical protein [Chitinispirillales bacterium]
MSNDDIKDGADGFDTEEKRRRALNASLRAANIQLLPYPYGKGERAEDRAHVAGFYISSLVQKEHAVYYAVELSLNGVTLTDEEINLDKGVFRWITGTPGFNSKADGAITENGKQINCKWYEGILIKDGMANPSRKIDIKESGDYATLNGFSFSIRNDEFFWQKIINKKLYVADSVVTVYAVLDKTFYSIWQGVVRSTAYTETEFIFKCETNFKVLHKNFPPLVVTETLIPNVSEKAVGKVIPVCFGDVSYAEGLNVSETVKAVTFRCLISDTVKDISVFAASGYDDIKNELTLRTPVVELIEKDELKGKYLRIVCGQGNAYYKIVTNEASTGEGERRTTDVTLEEKLSGYNRNSWYPIDKTINDTDYEKVWFFQIVNAPVMYAISQRPTLEAVNENGKPYDVCNYDDGYRSVEFAVLDRFYGGESGKNDDDNDIDNEDEEKGFKYAGFSTITEKDAGGKIDDEEVVELDAKSEHELVNGNWNNDGKSYADNTVGGTVAAEVELSIDKYKINDYERLYLGVDMDCICLKPADTRSGAVSNNWKITVSVQVKDNYGRYLGTDLLKKKIKEGNKDVDKWFRIENQEPVSYSTLNLISNDYYKTHSNYASNIKNDTKSSWDSENLLNLPESPSYLTELNLGMVKEIFNKRKDPDPEEPQSDDRVYSDKIRLKIIIEPEEGGGKISGVNLTLKEICFSTTVVGARSWKSKDQTGKSAITVCNAGKNNAIPILYSQSRTSNIKYDKKNFDKDTPFEKEFDIHFSDWFINERLTNADTVNLCIDSSIACYSNSNVNWVFRWEAYRIKADDGEPETGEDNNLFINKTGIGPLPVQNCVYNFLPDFYYESTDGCNPRNSLWPAVLSANDGRFKSGFDTKGMALLNPKIVEMIKTGALLNDIRVRVSIRRELNNKHNQYYEYNRSYPDGFTVKNNDVAIFNIRQIGLIGVNEQEFKEEGVYAINCKGEYSYSGNGDKVTADTIYGVFYNILKEYDGIVDKDGNIDPARIDIEKLEHLETVRGTNRIDGVPVWRTGRQILERKNSFNYLRELCKQSFVGIVPSRKGKLILSAWLD